MKQIALRFHRRSELVLEIDIWTDWLKAYHESDSRNFAHRAIHDIRHSS